ncbi:MAG: F0F1 ATP synthase subunit alpha [Patescibacteria group bacterium]
MPKTSLFSSLAQQLKATDFAVHPEMIGHVSAFGDGILKVDGLSNVRAGELVIVGENSYGLALNLEKNDKVGVVLLENSIEVSTGQEVRSTGQILSIGVSDEIIGRVVNPLGQAVDGKPAIAVKEYEALEKIAPGVMARQSVTVSLQTGIKGIDALIPIGRGQRQLIIGDRGTGKSSIALGAILNQKGQNVICIYVAIGQKRSFLSQTIAMLEKRGAMEYTTVVTASASDAASMQFLAPYAGVSVAEYFLRQGKDVLVVYDDLTKHAQAYREISLLLRRPSGREAYPGDVFYLHSRLLERACRLNSEHGGGSITALPIIETQANDISAFIPTNVISITDGQIYLESDLFNAGQKPAINIGTSVSRVGSAAQIKAMKQVAGSIKLDLAQFRELQAFAQFSSDLDEKTKKQLDRGSRINEILKQGWDEVLPVEQEVASMYAAVRGFLDQVEISKVKQYETELLEYVQGGHPQIFESIIKEQKITEDTEKTLVEALNSFNALHQEWMI